MEPNPGAQEDASQSSVTNRTDHSLVRRYRGGSQDAATELYLRYAQRLRGLTRAQLSEDLARKVEVDDIVQSVFGSFFRGVHNELYQVPAGEELWKLLLVIALHKIRSQGRYHNAARRDVRRTSGTDEAEQSLMSKSEADQANQAFLELVVEEALESLPAQNRAVVELRMEGREVMEIAEQLGRSKRTVERLLQQARDKLSALFSGGK